MPTPPRVQCVFVVPRAMPRQPRAPETWTIPTPPASYGELDDSRLVRHVRVPRRSTLREIKELLLHAYEVCMCERARARERVRVRARARACLCVWCVWCVCVCVCVCCVCVCVCCVCVFARTLGSCSALSLHRILVRSGPVCARASDALHEALGGVHGRGHDRRGCEAHAPDSRRRIRRMARSWPGRYGPPGRVSNERRGEQAHGIAGGSQSADRDCPQSPCRRRCPRP